MANILIVDDDEVIRDTLLELLSAEHPCQTAATAEMALTKLESQRFDVLLTDVSMSGLSGFDLVERVVQTYPNTAVIIISGISEEERAQDLIKLGAFDYIVKPFRLELVEESVRSAINSKQQSRSADPK